MTIHRMIVSIAIMLAFTAVSVGQEKKDDKTDPKKDPTAKTNLITETLNKIQNVDQLDRFVKENSTLKAQNKKLQQQIASLNKQVSKLQNDLKVENERMKKQLLQLPSISLKSMVVGANRSVALLQHGERTIRVRDDSPPISVQVRDGVFVLMKVKKISKDGVVLYFEELEREITLY